MISYKKIDISKIKLNNYNLLYNEKELVIKSPIINFKIINDNDTNFLQLFCNDNSTVHDIFLNVLGFIERIYEYNKINTNFISNNVINIMIDNNSRFFDINTKEIKMENIIGNKGIISIIFTDEKIILSQLLLIK